MKYFPIFTLVLIFTINSKTENTITPITPSEQQSHAITQKLILLSQQLVQTSGYNLEKITGQHKTVIEALGKNENVEDIKSRFCNKLIFQTANLIYQSLSMAIKIQEPAISLHTLIKCENEIPDNLLGKVTEILEKTNISSVNTSSKEPRKILVKILPLVPHTRVGKANDKPCDPLFTTTQPTSRRRQRRPVMLFHLAQDLAGESIPPSETCTLQLPLFPPNPPKTFSRIR